MRYLFPLALILIIGSFFLIDSGRDYSKDLSVKASSYIEGLRLVNRKNGADSFVIVAKRADFTKDETLVMMESVTVNVVKDGIMLNADKGTYNTSTRDIELNENIKIHIKGTVVSADRLSWTSSTGSLKSDSAVVVEGGKFRVEGDGLSATVDRNVKLLKNVKATFY